MKNFQLEGMGLIALSTEESVSFDAGHEGIAYSIGHFVGESLTVIGTVAGVVALILVPKS